MSDSFPLFTNPNELLLCHTSKVTNSFHKKIIELRDWRHGSIEQCAESWREDKGGEGRPGAEGEDSLEGGG